MNKTLLAIAFAMVLALPLAANATETPTMDDGAAVASEQGATQDATATTATEEKKATETKTVKPSKKHHDKHKSMHKKAAQ